MTDTITKAAQALIAAIKIDRHDWEDWPNDSRKAFETLKAALAAPQPEPQPVKQDPLAQTCGVCGYTGNNPDSLGQCPRCHWDELVPTVGNGLRSALNAMLTQFGMDEDEWNKPTFDQARAALAAPQPEPQPVKQAPIKSFKELDYKVGWQRYEKVRKLNVHQFSELFQRGLKGERFDEMVDGLEAKP